MTRLYWEYGCTTRDVGSVTLMQARCCQIIGDKYSWVGDVNFRDTVITTDSATNYWHNGLGYSYDGDCVHKGCDSGKTLVGCNGDTGSLTGEVSGDMIGNRIKDNVCYASKNGGDHAVGAKTVCATSINNGKLECVTADDDGANNELNGNFKSLGATCPNGYAMTDCYSYIADGTNNFECNSWQTFDVLYGESVTGNVCHGYGNSQNVRAQVRCCRIVDA
eukprot:200907_1